MNIWGMVIEGKKYNIETKELQRELSEHTAQVNEKSVWRNHISTKRNPVTQKRNTFSQRKLCKDKENKIVANCYRKNTQKKKFLVSHEIDNDLSAFGYVCVSIYLSLSLSLSVCAIFYQTSLARATQAHTSSACQRSLLKV